MSVAHAWPYRSPTTCTGGQSRIRGFGSLSPDTAFTPPKSSDPGTIRVGPNPIARRRGPSRASRNSGVIHTRPTGVPGGEGEELPDS